MNVALTVPVLPSVTVTSLIESDGVASSSVIVPMPCASVTRAPTALERFTANVSSPSSRTSPFTVTVIVFVVSPGRS